MLEDLSLSLCMLYLFFVDYLILPERLQRKVLTIIFLLNEHHLTKTTFTENFQDLEVINCYFFALYRLGKA